MGEGTERIEAALAERYPGIPVLRIDRDTMRGREKLGNTLAQIAAGEPCIAVGTQMIAKGHHFPHVTLVGVINADGGFLSPDFRAPERTAQLITQVAGRAGRAERPGTVLIQTYQPDNPLLRSLIEEGYGGFAARELLTREAAALPPFRPMALIRAESPNVADAMRLLGTLSDELRNASAERPPAAHGQLEVLGPVPAPIPRIANRYRGQLLVMATGRGLLHNALAPLRELTLPKDRNLRWSIDIDPYDAF